MIRLGQLWQSHSTLPGTGFPASCGEDAACMAIWPSSEQGAKPGGEDCCGGFWKMVSFLWRDKHGRELLACFCLDTGVRYCGSQLMTTKERPKRIADANLEPGGFQWPWGMSRGEPGEGEKRYLGKWEHYIYEKECLETPLESCIKIRYWGFCVQFCDLELPHSELGQLSLLVIWFTTKVWQAFSLCRSKKTVHFIPHWRIKTSILENLGFPRQRSRWCGWVGGVDLESWERREWSLAPTASAFSLTWGEWSGAWFCPVFDSLQDYGFTRYLRGWLHGHRASDRALNHSLWGRGGVGPMRLGHQASHRDHSGLKSRARPWDSWIGWIWEF